jgi:RNA polymerase sigma-70 factor (ECF subfamily)
LEQAELIERARSRDERAWEILVRQYQEKVFRLAYLLLGDRDDAEDVAQETFVRALHSLNRFDAERPLQPWLLAITKNLARNRLRSMGRYLNAIGRWKQEKDIESESSFNQRMEQTRANDLWKAVKTLKSGDQEVIYLRYFLDLSNQETADALSVANGTVKSRLHRALQRLEAVLEQNYPELLER